MNSLPPFYIQELFIWITPPNPLSNDMSHYSLDTAKGETVGFWQGVTRMPWRKTSLKWISEELDFGMITAHRICIPTGKIWLWKYHLDTVINCQGFFFSTFFCRRIWKTEFHQKLLLIFPLSTQMLYAHWALNTSGWNLPWTQQGECYCSTSLSGGPWTSICVKGKA